MCTPFTSGGCVGRLFLMLLCCVVVFVPQKSTAQQLLVQGSSIYFVKNKGQVFDTRGKARPDVEYVAESPGMNLFFTKEGVSYVFVEKTPKKEKKSEEKRLHRGKNASEVPSDSYIKEIKTHKVEMKIVGASSSMTILANQQADHYCNYYLPESHGGAIERVPVFRKLVYQNVYDNIDLVFYSAEQGIKYDFIVHPGGDVSDIRLKYKGANKVKLSQQGALQITTSLGTLQEHKPITFQEKDSVKVDGRKKKKKKDIQSSFNIENDEVSFSVASFNHNQTLVIDPGVKWFTYVGGSSGDYISSNFAIDGSGNIIVRGLTSSINLPVTTTASQTTLGGGVDAFVAKFTRSGNRLWATYFGGTAVDGTQDWAGAAIDASGNVYITGTTAGGSNFPVTSGAFQQTYGGGTYDAYLAKFNSDGIKLWATYVGGSNRDECFGIDVDSEGNVVIAGETASNNFPVSSGAFQTAHAGYHPSFIYSNSDAFVAKFSGSGQRLWCTYLGTATLGYEIAYAVTCDLYDNVIATGITPGANFPTTAGAFQTTYGGGQWDCFITKFNKTGSRIWSTYYGGNAMDYTTGIDVDLGNNVITTGVVQSTNFPVSSGAYQTSKSGGLDAFILKFDSTGQRQWATFYGGNLDDYADGVVIDNNNAVWVSGMSRSSNLPVTSDAFQSTNQGGWDGIVLKFSASGQRQWATWYGGAGADRACGIEIDQGDPVVVGYTASTTLSVSALAFQPTFAGSDDGFIVRFGSCSISTPVPSGMGMPQLCTPGPITVTLDAGNYEDFLWSNGTRDRIITIDQDGTYWVIVKDNTGCTATSAPIVIDIP